MTGREDQDLLNEIMDRAASPASPPGPDEDRPQSGRPGENARTAAGDEPPPEGQSKRIPPLGLLCAVLAAALAVTAGLWLFQLSKNQTLEAAGAENEALARLNGELREQLDSAETRLRDTQAEYRSTDEIRELFYRLYAAETIYRSGYPSDAAAALRGALDLLEDSTYDHNFPYPYLSMDGQGWLENDYLSILRLYSVGELVWDLYGELEDQGYFPPEDSEQVRALLDRCFGLDGTAEGGAQPAP